MKNLRTLFTQKKVKERKKKKMTTKIGKTMSMTRKEIKSTKIIEKRTVWTQTSLVVGEQTPLTLLRKENRRKENQQSGSNLKETPQRKKKEACLEKL